VTACLEILLFTYLLGSAQQLLFICFTDLSSMTMKNGQGNHSG